MRSEKEIRERFELVKKHYTISKMFASQKYQTEMENWFKILKWVLEEEEAKK